MEELKLKKYKKIMLISILILLGIFGLIFTLGITNQFDPKNNYISEVIQKIILTIFIISLIETGIIIALTNKIAKKIDIENEEKEYLRQEEYKRQLKIQQRAQYEIEVEEEKNRIRKNKNQTKNISTSNYQSKQIMSEWEKEFYKLLKKNFSEEYNIMAQVPLSSIINKENKEKYQSELYRTIDFGIFNEDFEPILLIELNDKTHNLASRKDRDRKVNTICEIANIPLLTFWSNDNKTNSEIIEEIKEKLKNE